MERRRVERRRPGRALPARDSPRPGRGRHALGRDHRRRAPHARGGPSAAHGRTAELRRRRLRRARHLSRAAGHVDLHDARPPDHLPRRRPYRPPDLRRLRGVRRLPGRDVLPAPPLRGRGDEPPLLVSARPELPDGDQPERRPQPGVHEQRQQPHLRLLLRTHRQRLRLERRSVDGVRPPREQRRQRDREQPLRRRDQHAKRRPPPRHLRRPR